MQPQLNKVWVFGQYSSLLAWLSQQEPKLPTGPTVSSSRFMAADTSAQGDHQLQADPMSADPLEAKAITAKTGLATSEPTAANLIRVTVEAPPGVTVRVTIESAAEGAAPVIHQEVFSAAPMPPIAAKAARLRLPAATSVLAFPWHEQLNLWTEQASRVPWLASGLRTLRGLAARLSLWEWIAVGSAVGLYLFTRLYALDAFPIFFFADEASIALIGERIFQNGFRDSFGTWFPIYFEGAGLRWTPVLTAYFQGLALTLFGKSIFVTRATSVLFSLLGVLAVAVILRSIFKARYWWLSLLALAVMPAWLIHTRTAFEAVTMAAFFACALLFYLLYRERSPRYVYPALIFGAATFYTYSNAQIIVLATAVLLGLSDWRYHWQQRQTVVRGALLLIVLALPLIVFQINRPGAFGTHLRELGSFAVRSGPLTEKIQQYLLNLSYGLSPQYWFWPNSTDLIRHRMPEVGHIPLVFLPLFLIGVVLCLRHVRSSAHRAVLLAALTAPAGAALVGIGVLRVLTFVIPATVFIVLGADWLLRRLPENVWVPRLALAGAATSTLLFFNQVLANSPFWYPDYGLYGMQYGAKQIFVDTLPDILRQPRTTAVYVSPAWANGANVFIDFFLPPADRTRVQMRDLAYYLFRQRPLTTEEVLTLTASECEQARTDPRFTLRAVEATIPYPDGSPGFCFVRLEYSPAAAAIYAAEEAERRQPVKSSVILEGQDITVIHSRFDAGQIADLFDGDTFSLARGMEANPLSLDFRFPEPRIMSGVRLTLGTMRLFQVSVEVYTPGNSTPTVFTERFANLPSDPTVTLPFGDQQLNVERLVLAITDEAPAETVNIHVREIVFEK